MQRMSSVARTVPVSDLQRTLDEMELDGDVASAVCPHCGATHSAPGSSMLMAFVCDNCSKAVKLPDDPGVEQIFGVSNRAINRRYWFARRTRANAVPIMSAKASDPGTGELDPPAELAEPAFCICPCHEAVDRA